MSGLKRVVTDNLSSGSRRDSSSDSSMAYCLQCMCVVGATGCRGGSQDKGLIKYHIEEKDELMTKSHELINMDEAVSRFKASLDSSMDNINAYFYKLHLIRSDMNHFEDAHEQCKMNIRNTAKELIKRIQDHESRLLEELDMQRDVEYKRSGLTDAKEKLATIENNLTNLQQICSNHMEQTDNHEFLKDVKLQREQTNRLLLDASNIDSLLEKANELRPSSFSPIRCNTAFGTLEMVNSKRNQFRNSMTPRKSSIIDPVSLPIPIPAQNGNHIVVNGGAHLNVRRNSSFNCSPVNNGRSRKLSWQVRILKIFLFSHYL